MSRHTTRILATRHESAASKVTQSDLLSGSRAMQLTLKLICRVTVLPTVSAGPAPGPYPDLECGLPWPWLGPLTAGHVGWPCPAAPGVRPGHPADSWPGPVMCRSLLWASSGHVTNRSMCSKALRTPAMLTFATKKLSTGANGQTEDAGFPFVLRVMIELWRDLTCSGHRDTVVCQPEWIELCLLIRMSPGLESSWVRFYR